MLETNHSNAEYANLFDIRNDTLFLFDNQASAIYTNELKEVNCFSISSTTHLSFINLLSDSSRNNIFTHLCGATNDVLLYAQNEAFRRLVSENQVANIGTEYNLDAERLATYDLHFSSYNSPSTDSRVVFQTNCTNLPICEWKESSPLGRAEWIKVFAYIFNIPALGDSIFHEIETAYIAEKSNISTKKEVKVIVGEPYQGIWHFPSKDSYIGNLISDAGGTLIATDTKETPDKVSIPVEIEQAILKFKDADVWLNVSFNSIGELLSAYPYCKDFKCVKTGNVYNNRRRDYWESAVANPHILLHDIDRALNSKSDSLYYLQRLIN